MLLSRRNGFFLCGVAVFLFASVGWAESGKPVEIPAPPKVFEKKNPESVDDLKQIEKHVKVLTERLTPCVVNLRLNGSEGSGVVVSEDGYILTAGHVSGRPNLNVTIVFPDGKEVKGKTLGMDSDIDSGMVKITDEGKWPFTELGKSADLKKGQWVLTLGHPNGFKKGRPPVVRVGRVLGTTKSTVTTDTFLVGGDSGGPLFDMTGKVVGIHSRIGENINENVHVPVDVFRDGWDDLIAGVPKGGSFGRTPPPYLGVELENKDSQLVVSKVEANSPAEKGGIKTGDAIIKLDDKTIYTIAGFRRQLAGKKPDEEIKVEVKRGEQTLTLTVTLSKGTVPVPKKKKDKD